jgi:ribosome biogenesis GTPase A
MAEKLKICDVLIEVRDARIPFTSQNTQLDKLFKNKKKVIVFNKSDLASQHLESKIANFYKGTPVVFTNSINNRNIAKIIPALKQLDIKKPFKSLPTIVMIFGIPNIGKSSILNALTGKKKCKVGALPGVTQTVNGYKIDSELFLLDTPGIMLPKIDTLEEGYKLALVRSIADGIVPADMLVGYLLFVLNSRKAHKYVEEFHLNGPVETVDELVGKDPHRDQFCVKFLDYFRRGKLGTITLDTIPEEIPPIQPNHEIAQ